MVTNIIFLYVQILPEIYVSIRDYYCYNFQMRPGIFNPILHGKRLFQQFAVDTYVKIESSRLDYFHNN
jgi:hypothetical protein